MIFTTSSSRTAARRSRWCARRCSARMAADRCSELLWALDRHPRAELDHGTVGQTEIFGGIAGARAHHHEQARSEEHTSELQSLMRISYAVFCLKKKI